MWETGHAGCAPIAGESFCFLGVVSVSSVLSALSFMLVSACASSPVVSRGCAVTMPLTCGGGDVVFLLLLPGGLFSLPCAMAVVFSFTCGDGGAVSVFLAGSPVSSPGSGEACLDSVKHKSVRDRVMRCVESCEEM